MKKVQLSIDDALLDRIDATAREKGLNRSAFVSVACDDYIRATEKGAEIKKSFDKLLEGMHLKINGFDDEGDAIMQEANAMAKAIAKSK